MSWIPGRLCIRDDAGKGRSNNLNAFLGFLFNFDPVAAKFCFQGISNLGIAKMLRDFRTYLRSITIDCLLAAEDKIKGSFSFFDFFNGLGKNVACGKGIGTAEDTVSYQVGGVSGNGQTFFQCIFRLLRSHGKNDDFGVRIGIFYSRSRL